MAAADPHGYMNDLNIYGDFIDSTAIDANVILGDIVRSSWFNIGEPLYQYNYWNKTLRIVGNHDVLNATSGYDWTQQASQTDVYNRYFATDNPVDMAVNTTYWKKEYSDKQILVIGGNCMLITEAEQQAQYSFFENALNQALSKNLTVVICYHWPLNTPYESLSTNFSIINIGYFYGGRAHSELYSQTLQFEQNLLHLVDNYISNGGKFACWLNGHEHTDDIGVFKGSHKQLYVNIASYHYVDFLVTHGLNYTDGLAFNMIEISQEDESVIVYRYGANYGRNIGHLTKCKIGYRGDIREIG